MLKKVLHWTLILLNVPSAKADLQEVCWSTFKHLTCKSTRDYQSCVNSKSPV